MIKKAVIKMMLVCTVPLLFIGFSTDSTAQNKKTIALFSPGKESNFFWGEMIEFGKSVADKLDMNLLVYYGNDNADLMAKNMETAANRKPKPDGFIFPSMIGQGDRYIKIAEKLGIPAILVNMGIENDGSITSTRTVNANLLGQVTPDDEGAGYELAKTLIQAAKAAGKRNISLLAFTAQDSDISATLRVKGLQRALKEFRDVKLNRIVNTDWSSEQTVDALKAEADLNKVTIIWAVSDDMAIAASKYMKEKGFNQGKEVFIGGVDWTQNGLNAVKSGVLTTSVGGHFAEIGWGLILFFDYLNGSDFASESTMYKSAMKPLTAKNVGIFINTEDKYRWADVNFRLLSKVLNPRLKKYRFDLVTLLRMAKN